ncbi:MAG: threonine synthase [Chloroflexi bacterium]|nr:threonine synthase [Chloroflexota bacterium]
MSVGRKELQSDELSGLSSISLRCVECSALYPMIEGGQVMSLPRYRCNCGGVLDAEVSSSSQQLDNTPDAATGSASWQRLFDERASRLATWPSRRGNALLDASGVWRYRELVLPLPERFVVSRPEGNTGLYPVGTANCGSDRPGHRQIGLYAGLEDFFLKHEGENPTGSFKDRGMTVGITMANLLGAKAVACASTGNTSASLASYAAQAGMRSIVFLPAGSVAPGKLAQSLAYGATTIQVRGDFDDAMRLVEQVCDELSIYLLNSLNPFRIEGQKAIAFELLQQLDWDAPDWLVLPAGNLGNTSAIGKALQQAYRLSLIGRIPRIASIQAAGANPFYRSFMSSFASREVVEPHTVASAIKIGNPVSYARARHVIEMSDGVVEEVSDEEILAAKGVIDRAGIGCEPASAATLAGVHKLVARGIIKGNDRVVGVLTGNLLKDSVTGIAQEIGSVVVEPHIDAVRAVLS